MAVQLSDVTLIYSTANAGALRAAQVLTDLKLSGKGLDADLLDQITIFLAAHFSSITDGVLSRDRFGDADQSFKAPGDKDQGLKATLFGQQALLLDDSGTLASIGASASSLKALFTVVGSGASTFP